MTELKMNIAADYMFRKQHALGKLLGQLITDCQEHLEELKRRRYQGRIELGSLDFGPPANHSTFYFENGEVYVTVRPNEPSDQSRKITGPVEVSAIPSAIMTKIPFLG